MSTTTNATVTSAQLFGPNIVTACMLDAPQNSRLIMNGGNWYLTKRIMTHEQDDC